MRRHARVSVFGKTLSTSIVVFLAIQILTFGISTLLVVRPLVKTAVTDFAYLVVNDVSRWHAARTPQEKELAQEGAQHHGIEIYPYSAEPKGSSVWLWYTEQLQMTIAEMTGQSARIYSLGAADEMFALRATIAGEKVVVQFRRSRIATKPTKALLISILVGAIFSALGALLISRQVTKPLQKLYNAVSELGSDGRPTPLDESGPREFAALSVHFNAISEQLGELLNARALLLAGISHDLRTPIARMRLSLELLGDTVEPELARGLQSDTELMDRLIGQFLDFARSNEMVTLEELDLRELVDGVVSRFVDSGATIEWNPSEEAWLAVDPLALERVIQNLIGNAIAHGKGSPIVVSLKSSVSMVEIGIRDSGPGIPEDALKEVFEPFYRVAQDARTAGSGLGLAIVAQICRNRGWKISLENAPEGGLEARLLLDAPDAPSTCEKQ